MTPCARCHDFPAGDDPNYLGLCALCAWRQWATENDPEGYWSKVKCILCALERDCPEHPGGLTDAENLASPEDA
jgi:hypothetical protein